MSDSSTLRPSTFDHPIELIDTHCHIHDSEFLAKYAESADEILTAAEDAGVQKLVCVGTDLKSSIEAVSFAKAHNNCVTSLAIHPHEVANTSIEVLLAQVESFKKLLDENDGSIVAIGECGLDYFYHQDVEVRELQKTLLRAHIELAKQYDLPLIFHIRDSFDDFFSIYDEFNGLTGVIHSFSAGINELEGAIRRGLYIGLNGIMTFTNKDDQLEAAKRVPVDKIVLETDAPFLTPKPFRGTMCKPEHIRVTADFISELRGETLEVLASATTANAKKLFSL